MWPLILLGLVATTSCLPLEEKEDPTPTTESIEQIQKTIKVVSYIQNFKNVMADYVNSQYNLTVHDMEKIKQTLEEFLISFANDLRETVEEQQKNVTFEKEREKIQDGVPDATFKEIRDRIMTEFPDIKEETADVIVYKLRKNLYETRQKIDYVIKTSSEREFEYAIA
ncbi:uncharacterized protein LOC133532758 isoform X2 [Cydia pomonella]|uniref:uncharacterized protein LOC133532758 isoform X2 n=1 Tax=Cydia pomonella TaxID=82600 RepID=UPI002ADE3172|nr:uncharacterized protein LOC133532758 isoform X2 [Cydia pomonella]